MKNNIRDPNFKDQAIWVLDFQRESEDGKLELIIPERAKKRASPLVDPGALEQIKKDTRALKKLEKMCEELKSECLEELEKELDTAEDSKQITESLAVLESLMQRFFDILHRFRKE